MKNSAIEIEVFDHETRTTVVQKKFKDYGKAVENAENLSRQYSQHTVYLFKINYYGTHVTRMEWKNGVHDESKDYTWRIGY